MFRRRRGRHAAGSNGDEADLETDSARDDLDAEGGGADPFADGPWDVDEAPGDDVARVDLGALLLPTLAEVELRVEADASGEISTIALVHEANIMQVHVFAAPRSEGIWDEVRGEIEEELRGDGAVTETRRGDLGTELWATVAGPEGKQPLRFVGIDGPRWFLRLLLTGPAATDPALAPALFESVRRIVVVRGDQPLPVRDPLPLRLPNDVVEQAQQTEEPASRTAPSAPRRGPEITEIG